MRNPNEQQRQPEPDKNLFDRFEDAVTGGCTDNGPGLVNLGTGERTRNMIRWGLHETPNFKVGFYYRPSKPTYFALLQSKEPETEIKGDVTIPVYPTLVLTLEPDDEGLELSKTVVINYSPVRSFTNLVLSSEPAIRSEEPPKPGQAISRDGREIRYTSTRLGKEEYERLNRKINEAEDMAKSAGFLDVDPSEVEIVEDVSKLLQRVKDADENQRKILHEQAEEQIRKFQVFVS